MGESGGFKIYWGDVLRELRRNNQLTQSEVAEVIHITRQAYSNIECGKSHPTPESLAILSDLYNVDLYDYVLKSMPTEYVAEQNSFKIMMKANRKNSNNTDNGSSSRKRRKYVKIINPDNKGNECMPTT